MKMAEYPKHFGVVEVQQTFYQPPEDATMIKWREQFSSSFEFTIKAWQLITHASSSGTYKRLRRKLSESEKPGLGGFRPSPIVAEGLQRTLECASLLKATAILFQCPASFRPTPESVKNFRTFFTRLRRPKHVRLMWEPRGSWWSQEQIAELCTELDLLHVVDPFVNATVTGAPAYFRLHGVSGSRHMHTDAELKQFARLGAVERLVRDVQQPAAHRRRRTVHAARPVTGWSH